MIVVFIVVLLGLFALSEFEGAYRKEIERPIGVIVSIVAVVQTMSHGRVSTTAIVISSYAPAVVEGGKSVPAAVIVASARAAMSGLFIFLFLSCLFSVLEDREKLLPADAWQNRRAAGA